MYLSKMTMSNKKECKTQINNGSNPETYWKELLDGCQTVLLGGNQLRHKMKKEF